MQNTQSILGKPEKPSKRTIRYDSFREKLDILDKTSMLDPIEIKNQNEETKLTTADRERHERLKKEFDDITKVPIFYLKENFPIKVTFDSRNQAYLKIDCLGKQFPIHFFCNMDKMTYIYYINFIDKQPLTTKYQQKIENSGKFDITPPNFNINESLNAKNHDFKNKVVWILIEAPGMRSSNFSYNFTSTKYLSNQTSLSNKDFSKEHICQLFRIEDNFDGPLRVIIQKKVDELKEKRKLNLCDILEKNKRTAANFTKYSIKNICEKIQSDKFHLSEVIKRSKESYKKNMDKKIEFNSHHDKLKQNIYNIQKLLEQKENKYYYCYTWLVLLYLLDSTAQVKGFYAKKMEKAFSHKRQVKHAIKIQRCIRKKLNKVSFIIQAFDNRKQKNLTADKKYKSDRISCKAAINAFCTMQKINANKKALRVVMKFTSIICEPYK